MHEKLNKVLQLADICSKYEHAGDELTNDVEHDFDSVDFEHLDKDMIVSTQHDYCNWLRRLTRELTACLMIISVEHGLN